MERGSSENRGAGGPAARRRPAPVGFGHASFYRRKPRHYTMAHNRSPLSRGSAEFWNQIAGHMLSAHRSAMQKTRGDRKSVVEGKGVSVRVDPGGRSSIKKKKKE